MPDHLLETRIRELVRILGRMVMPWSNRALVELYADTNFKVELDRQLISPEMRLALENRGSDGVRPLALDLKDLAERLDELDDDDPDYEERLKGMWEEYRDAETRCAVLFEEFIDLIGGLAFRDRIRDEWFFNTADHLLRLCATRVQQDSYRMVALPWMQDTIRCSLAQLVRLRFPDWTVWALPLAAFGFGRIYLTERDDKPAQVRERIRRELGMAPDAPFDDELITLMADVFATGVLGPAYALAAMRLRLTPDETPRAYVILKTLELLGPHDAALVEALRREWLACVAVTPLEASEKEALENQVEKVFKAFVWHFREPARYPRKKWRYAVSLCGLWEDQYSANPDDVPHVAPEDRTHLQVPEVLNAAWYARWKEFAADGLRWDVDKLAAAARQTCMEVLDASAAPDTAPARSASQGQRLSAYGRRAPQAPPAGGPQQDPFQ
jgi:hypothetical protein